MNEIFNGVMRAVNSLLGLLMMLGGGVWILQGLNIAFLQSFMAGRKEWVLFGAILFVVGVAEIIWSNTRARYYSGR